MFPKKEHMQKAIDCAIIGINMGYGGPFGSVIVDANGNELSSTCNTVLYSNNPTQHGEINAISKACEKLGSYDLSGCVLYTTAYPCPMCLGAIIWANIEQVYYGCTTKDTSKIGFRDNSMYSIFPILKHHNCNMVNLKEFMRKECLQLFERYKQLNHTIY